MKWVFIACLLVFIPTLTAILRSHPKYRLHVAFLMGALPLAVVPYLYVAPISWAGWPGPVKGVEVSLLDGVALAVVLSTPGVRIPMSLKLSFAVLVLALIISSIVGYQTMPSIFYAWQLARTVLLFMAVARLCVAEPRAPLAMIAGLGAALSVEALYAVRQYLGGDPRPGGNLGHSNFLGLASDFIVFPALALLMGGRRLIGPAIIVGAGLVIAIVGGSRATLGLFGIGSFLTILLSINHRRSPRKMAFAGAAALMLIAAIPAVIWAVNRRSEADKLSSDEERASMKLAASMMATDHPLGVGADQYVIVANSAGYSARAGVPWNADDRSAPVHDAYYLVTAELGFLGLIGFIALLASLILLGFRNLKRVTADVTSEMTPGLLATMIIVAIHISYEWVFMHFVLHYMLGIAAGMLVAIAARSKLPAKAWLPSSNPTLVASRAG